VAFGASPTLVTAVLKSIGPRAGAGGSLSLFSKPLSHSLSIHTARHSPLAGGGVGGDTDWKDALATLQVPKGDDGDPLDADDPILGWGSTFSGGDEGDEEDDGAIAASFDLDGPDGDEEEEEGDDSSIESSWNEDDDGEDFAFIPDEAGDRRGGWRGAASSSSGGVVEEILFSLEDGWGLEAVSAAEAAAATSSAATAAPIQTNRKRSQQGEDDDDEAAPPLLNPKSALASIPAHVLASLKAAQAKASVAAETVTPNALRRAAAERRTHRRLRIIGGASAGRRLLSGAGETTRPMMDKVRAALFDALSAGGPAGPGRLPPTSTWLDLFAGTGAVGLEAISRGARAATFVEMDSWVVSTVLKPNLASCEGDWADAGRDDPVPAPTPVQGRAEDFIARHPGPAFDYVSVCPPYEAVSYAELMAALDAATGRVLHEHSFVIVEYPRLATKEMPERLGPLARLRDRKYGRTLVAIYGPE
jgi:16S rRNA (guanine(966)-N(2))-methyltransferase RsmD